jgi:hypothetical protein
LRLLVAFLSYLSLCSPALTEAPMSDDLCTQSSAMDVTVSTLLKPGKAFDCSDNTYDVKGARVWENFLFSPILCGA